MADYWGDDGWDYRSRRGAYEIREREREREYLAPRTRLSRSRSHGHSPTPTINVYNRVNQDADMMPPYPGAFPPPAPSPRATPRASPEHRHRMFSDILEERLAGDVADMALDHRYNRSHSRGQAEAQQASTTLAEYQLAQKERELKELEHKRDWQLNEERIRNQIKLDELKSQMRRDREAEFQKDRNKQLLEAHELKAREEKERREILERSTLENYQRKLCEEKEKQTELEKRVQEDLARKEREAKEKAEEEEKRVREKIDREKKAKEDAEEKAYKEFKEKERLAKEEKEQKYNEFLREQKEKEDKKKEEEKEKEELFQVEMRKRLTALGYTEQTIDVMVDREKAKQFKEKVERKTDVQVYRHARSPVYPKVHRDYLAIETLQFYDLPWEYDPSDPNFIIILRDMEKHETDVLFEHTTRLRSRTLLLESAPKKDKEYAWVRRRSRSRSNAKIGILEIRR